MRTWTRPRRAELLAEIKRAEDVRADARRDLAGGVIDRVDWLDIRQRTEDAISKARREYDVNNHPTHAQ